MQALYLSHTGMSEPLGQSQVLPYLRGLSRNHGWRFHIVGFEPPESTDVELRLLTEALNADGISYSWSRRSRSHALATKLGESVDALARLALHTLRERPRVIHARSYLPAAVGLTLATALPRAKLIFDCRGLLADEYVDAGHWVKGSLQYRLVKQAERSLFGRADAVVTLTDRLRRWLLDRSLLHRTKPVEVIPCCVDMTQFQSHADARRDVRTLIGAGQRLVVVYSGSLGSWYREPDIARLFAAIRRRCPALLLLLTRSATDELLGELAKQGVPAADIQHRSVAPRDMPAFLSAADAGISLIRSCFSKMASSPTKIAEYLAIGLPVAMNTDIGDGRDLAGASEAVIDVGAMTPDDCEHAATSLVRAAATPGIADRARSLADSHFSVDGIGVKRYARLYARVLNARRDAS